jgi:hypothetical protein
MVKKDSVSWKLRSSYDILSYAFRTKSVACRLVRSVEKTKRQSDAGLGTQVAQFLVMFTDYRQVADKIFKKEGIHRIMFRL